MGKRFSRFFPLQYILLHYFYFLSKLSYDLCECIFLKLYNKEFFMSFLNNASNFFRKNKESLLNEISKYRNSTFMEAVVAATVLIAAADGNISAEEKKKLLAYVQMSDELKAFSTEDVINIFNKLASSYEFDASIGKGEALKYINRVKGKDEQARLVVRVAIAIANSDGNFDESEKKALQEICSELELSITDFI